MSEDSFPLPPRFISTTTGPLSLEFLGHSSVESYDLDAGYSDAALEAADRFLVHRDTIDEFNDSFTPIAERISGVTRDVDKKRTDKAKRGAVNPKNVSPVLESMVTYLNRVVALKPECRDELQREALRISRLIAISAAPAERKTPVEPMFFKRADSLLEADLDTINSKLSKLLAVVPDFEIARDEHEKPTRTSLARLLQKYEATRWADED